MYETMTINENYLMKMKERGQAKGMLTATEWTEEHIEAKVKHLEELKQLLTMRENH